MPLLQKMILAREVHGAV